MKKWCLLVVLVLAFTCAAVLSKRPFRPEPVYQGKPISNYLLLLASEQYQARNEAREAFEALGPDAVPYLTRALATRDSALIQYVPRLLRQLPVFCPDTINRALLRQRAAELLGNTGSTQPAVVTQLIRALTDSNAGVRAEAQRSLRKLGSASVPQLAATLSSRSTKLRIAAAATLADMGVVASNSFPQLRGALRDRSPEVRSPAMFAIGSVCQDAQVAVPLLVKGLRDPDPLVRKAAAEALGTMGVKALPAVPALQLTAGDGDPEVALAGAAALWAVSRQPDLVLGNFINAINHPRLAWQANLLLAQLGPAAKPALPNLLLALRAERVHRPLRTPPSSAIALGGIGEPAVPGLVLALGEPEPRIRTSAAIALGYIGKLAIEAVPALVRSLDDRNHEVRQAATLSLASIDPENQALIPALKQLAREDDVFLRGLAASHLRRLAPKTAAELGWE